jgi:sterol desaturase/sphingolipid hydroxylase (fatty acid hydroxylase superfamily)
VEVSRFHEALARGVAFAVVFASMALWELLAPALRPVAGRRARWPANLGVAALGTLLVRVALPLSAVELAALAEAGGWGLLARLALPWPVSVLVSVVALDLAIYLAHVLFHAVPALWRLHRMHHSDLAFDATTGVRFHPFESLLSMLAKLGVIAALGAPPVAVLVFEVLLNATSLFNHGNVHISPRLDRALRWVLVTPDMHRVHHSVVPREANSNFGFNLPWWDRLFGTYRADPAAGRDAVVVGVDQFRKPRELRLDRMLLQPFRGGARRYPLGRGDGGA